jgi:hypothetical protein
LERKTSRSPRGKRSVACYAPLVPPSESAPSRTVVLARDTLLALLETAYGSTPEAHGALDRALRQASLSEVPASAPELLSFVRAGLLPILSEELGPRLTMTVLGEFIAEHEIRTGVRPQRPTSSTPPAPPRSSRCQLRVLLVDSDRIARPTLARALLREGCQVTAVDSLEELGVVARTSEEVDVAILDGRHPAKLLLMEVIVERFPGAALVVRSAGEAATRALLGALGVTRFDVLPADAPAEALVGAVLKRNGARSP